jgi:uncharacterized delta-60 repeat protein
LRRRPGIESLESRTLLAAAGSLDTSFGGGDGIAPRNLITSEFNFTADAALQADGKIVALGNTGENLFVARYTADGILDRTFGAGGGMVPFNFSDRVNEVARRVLVQPDQKILVSGDDGNSPQIARFNPDGTVDTSFGKGGIASSAFGPRDTMALALQPDGKILVGGQIGVFGLPGRGYQDFDVQRFTAGGQIDPSFGDGGTVITDFTGRDDAVSGLAVLGDGRIVAAGTSGLARYNADGSIDTTFGGGDGKVGDAPDDPAFTADGGIAVLPDGRLLVAGHDAQFGIAVARYLGDGTPDTTFHSSGAAQTPGVSATLLPGNENHAKDVALTADGSALVVGWTRPFNAQGTAAYLARFTPAGDVDTGFSGDGYLTASFADPWKYSLYSSVMVLPGGRVLASGSQMFNESPPSGVIIQAYTPAGNPDLAFGTGGGRAAAIVPRGANDYATDLLVQPDGKTVVVGMSGYGSYGPFNGAVLRFNPDGTPDAGFGAGGLAQPDFPSLPERWYAALRQADGKILLGGVYFANSDTTHRLLARLNPDGSTDTTFGANGFRDLGPGVIAELEALPDGRFLTAGGKVFSRHLPDGSPDPTFGTGGQVTVASFPGAPSESGVNDLAVLPDGSFYVLAQGSTLGRLPDPPQLESIIYESPFLYRFTAAGAPDATFGSGGRAVAPGYFAAFTSIALDRAGRIVIAGSKNTVDGDYNSGQDAAAARFLPDGTLDPAFGNGGKVMADLGARNDWVSDVAIQDDGKVLLAGSAITYLTGNVSSGDAAVARFNPDGSPERWFGDHGVARFDFDGGHDVLAALAVQPDGKILAAGGATFRADVPIIRPSSDFVLVRLEFEGMGADAGGPYDVAEGGAVRLAGDAQTLPGASIVSLAWDFDYDGATFDADATGPEAVLSGPALDGPSTRTVALRATDSEGRITIDTAAVRIANTPPTLSVNGPDTGKAGQPFLVQLSASDPAAEQLTWTIDWGDGTPADALPGAAPGATHTYADGRNRYVVTATASDEDATYAGGVLRVVIDGPNDAPAMADEDLVPSSRVMNERDYFVLQGSFRDPDTADTHRVTVHWGDGTPDEVLDLDPGVLIFEAAHNYADDDPPGTPEDSYTIRVTTDDGAASASASTVVTVRNVAPSVKLGTDRGTIEGAPVLIVPMVFDPGAGPTEPLTYLWHVSSTNGEVVADENEHNFTFTPSDDGTYTVSLTVSDDDGGTTTDSMLVGVANAVPKLTAALVGPVLEGSPLTLRLGATDPGPDTITKWTIDWGDGATDTLPGDATQASHAYADGQHNYLVAIAATDEDGTYSLQTFAPAGALDRTFGTDGTKLLRQAFIWDMATQPDGKIVTLDGAIPDLLIPWKLSRFNADGSPDASFGTNGVVTVPGRPRLLAQAFSLLPDGKFLVVGFDDFDAGQKGVIARYNPDGTPDATFGTGGFLALGLGPGAVTRFSDLAVLGDGRIVVAGTVMDDSATTLLSLFATRLNPDGTPDTSFGTGGRTAGVVVGNPANHVPALLVQSDGKLVIGDERIAATGLGGRTESTFIVARFTADGLLDNGFGTRGVFTALPGRAARVRDLAELPDGRIVAAGYAGATATTLDAAAVRLLPDGTLDPSFDGDGIFRSGQNGNDSANAVVVTPDGGILLAGYTEGIVGGDAGTELLWLLPDGSRNGGFGIGGLVITRMPNALPLRYPAPPAALVLLLPDGKILAGGFGGMARYGRGGLPLNVANVAPTASFAPDGSGDGVGSVRFSNQGDPSPADTAAGFRYSYDFNNDGDFADAELGEADGVADASRSTPFTAPGVYTVRGRIADRDGGFTDYTARVLVRGVAGRHVFYNHSAFDGNDAANSAADDGAIAPDKSPLLAGADAAPSSANITGYDKGLNGLMVDIAGLPDDATLTADDFDFGAAGAPVSITVRRGAGINGSDRVTLVWRDYNPLDLSPLPHAVANGWLTVTVKANPRTGLAQSDVFSVGNLIGETGDGGGAAGWRVSALDLGSVKAALNTTATPSSKVDVNHDGRVNALDLGVLKRSLNRSLAPLIPAPVAPVSAAAQSAAAQPPRVADDILR